MLMRIFCCVDCIHLSRNAGIHRCTSNQLVINTAKLHNCNGRITVHWLLLEKVHLCKHLVYAPTINIRNFANLQSRKWQKGRNPFEDIWTHWTTNVKTEEMPEEKTRGNWGEKPAVFSAGTAEGWGKLWGVGKKWEGGPRQAGWPGLLLADGGKHHLGLSLRMLSSSAFVWQAQQQTHAPGVSRTTRNRQELCVHTHMPRSTAVPL